ncbi:MAG: HAMP domain-containing sensor histidine kinase [Trueperaceae bacterium]
MSLRNRLSLTIVALTLLAAVGFGVLTYETFSRQQDAQLRALLEQDLDRVAAILVRPTLGASFGDTEASAFVLQFVTPDGQVVMSWGDSAPLPPASSPQVVRLDDRPYLVSQTTWGATGGTIRLAHDIEAPFRARRQLARNLLLNGTLIVLIAAFVGLVTTRRHLRPLGRVSEQARAIDPGAPNEISYKGPNDEIHDLAQALNIALAAIRSRQEEERAFLLEVSHELAAPLTLVRYHLANVQGEQPGDSRLVAAADAARELLRTSQDLLVLARGELERPLEPRVFFLEDLLKRVQAEYPGVLVYANTSCDVVGDPERLMQVVRNLVRNGLQAAGSPEKVRVTLSSEGAEQVLEVVDEGPGIRREALERVFEHRFSENRGVGVGLSVARSIVEQHGGVIAAFSEPGAGSRFEVRLPSLESRLEPSPLIS